MTTPLHLERMDAVLAALRDCGTATVVDLGCGEGPLLLRLAQEPRVQRIVGLDCCLASLERCAEGWMATRPRSAVRSSWCMAR